MIDSTESVKYILYLLDIYSPVHYILQFNILFNSFYLSAFSIAY